MTVRSMEQRSTRVVENGEASFRAVVAWRGRSSDRGLLYFVALDGEGADPDDRRDRRALLEPGRALADLSDGELRERLEGGAPLTDTERRFRAPDGRLWLAQSIGPVWADEDPAEGATGLLLTSLEGPHERLRAPGAHASEMEEDELADLWRAADTAGDDGDHGGGDADGDEGS